MHQDEAVKRKGFTEACEGHFLTLLFPGIVEQFSPSFATSPPSPFDTNLPPVTIEDLERLKNALPTLWATLQLPNNIRVIVSDLCFILHQLYPLNFCNFLGGLTGTANVRTTPFVST